MQKWEYAKFYWGGPGMGAERWVSFTHGQLWQPITKEEYWKTLRRLSDESWELVSMVKETNAHGFTSVEISMFKRLLTP